MWPELLRTLHGPILEDAVAARADVALHGGLVGTAAVKGARDDAGVRPDLLELRKPGKSGSAMAWMLLEQAVGWRTRGRG